MEAQGNVTLTLSLALVVGIAVAPSLSGCTARVSTHGQSTSPVTKQPPPASAEPTASAAPKKQAPAADADPKTAAAYYFGNVSQVDVTLQNRAIAYWRVEGDTTATAGAAAAALAFMGRHYSHQGRAMVLRLDTRHGESTSIVSLYWNPLDKTTDTRTYEPLPPHSLTVSVGWGTSGRFAGISDITYTVSGITAETLSAGPSHILLLRLLQASGLQ